MGVTKTQFIRVCMGTPAMVLFWIISFECSANETDLPDLLLCYIRCCLPLVFHCSGQFEEILNSKLLSGYSVCLPLI